MSTIATQLQKLPAGYNTLALAAFNKHRNRIAPDVTAHSPQEAVMHLPWSRLDEGAQFWEDVFNHLSSPSKHKLPPIPADALETKKQPEASADGTPVDKDSKEFISSDKFYLNHDITTKGSLVSVGIIKDQAANPDHAVCMRTVRQKDDGTEVKHALAFSPAASRSIARMFRFAVDFFNVREAQANGTDIPEDDPIKKTTNLAKVVYAGLREFSGLFTSNEMAAWNDLAEVQRNYLCRMVLLMFENQSASDEQLHNYIVAAKVKDGCTYGKEFTFNEESFLPITDPTLKPYDELTREQQRTFAFARSMVRGLTTVNFA